MTEPLLALSDGDLRELASLLRSRRLTPPFSPLGVQRIVAGDRAEAVVGALQSFSDDGFGVEQLATILELLVKDRAGRSVTQESIELVTTGPEAPGVTNRDTSVVVRDLFAYAEHSVLLAGYAVYQGQQVFRALADRMRVRPEMQVRMFLDIGRGPGDTSISSDLVHRFAERFKARQWPTDRRLPEVFYDPRSLELTVEKRACLHAKCIVVDQRAIFVSSANFTEAAQERNVEVGLLIRSPALAQGLVRHFETLVEVKALVAAF
jgi:phosphatidylserine/phosphatidylglycerophosphate/cardiolipin synthase-like enzyme